MIPQPVGGYCTNLEGVPKLIHPNGFNTASHLNAKPLGGAVIVKNTWYFNKCHRQNQYYKVIRIKDQNIEIRF